MVAPSRAMRCSVKAGNSGLSLSGMMRTLRTCGSSGDPDSVGYDDDRLDGYYASFTSALPRLLGRTSGAMDKSTVAPLGASSGALRTLLRLLSVLIGSACFSAAG